MIIEFGVDMKSIRKSLKTVLFLSLVFFNQIIFPGLVKDTFVRVGLNSSDIKKVQELNVGDTVLSFKESGNGNLEFIKVPIKAISVEKQNQDEQKSKLVLLDIVSNDEAKSQLLVHSNAVFYSSETNKWISALDLSLDDKLLDVNSNEISISRILIEEQDSDIEAYELSLQDPHYYFICDSFLRPILIHNNAAHIVYELIHEIPKELPVIIDTTVKVGSAILVATRLSKVLGIENACKKALRKKSGSGRTKDKDKPWGHDPVKDELTKDADKEKVKPGGKSNIYSKPGGNSRRLSDFDKLGLIGINSKPNGTLVGTLPDGRTVNSRDGSSDGRPTNEIIHADDSRTKIRYDF